MDPTQPTHLIRTEEDAAQDAAAQAEFNEKRWVWVPDDIEGYLPGFVTATSSSGRTEPGAGDEPDSPSQILESESDSESVSTVTLANGSGTRTIPTDSLSKMNPPKFDRVNDIADLTFLNEASVVHNLKLRFGAGSIYTYSGLFLISLNPYTPLPLYTNEIIAAYRNAGTLSKGREGRGGLGPHIYAVAEEAWTQMRGERQCQSVLITGESGAGKTENTKKVIQYLAAIAGSLNNGGGGVSGGVASRSHSSNSVGTGTELGLVRTSSFSPSASGSSLVGQQGLLETRILQANPILESFGNAQTLRNNNSSRFGKFIRLLFNSHGAILGANIDWYLLEKSRVVSRSEGERNFHVFYQLLRSGRKFRTMREKLFLNSEEAGAGEKGKEPREFRYLKESRDEIDGVDDEQEWKVLQNAMTTVGFTPDEAFDTFRIVAAILHIGNIIITSDYASQAQITSLDAAEIVSKLLGIELSEFLRSTLRPTVKAGRELVTQARSKEQATAELAALCKLMYEKAFAGLVERMNRALDKPGLNQMFIGVLDIAGFEIFEVNGYEQLLINFTNERLQQFFNHHMFVLEQDEYNREQIQWSFVNFGLDLQPTIDLIESSNPIGILPTLDEECIMPKATDSTFLDKIKGAWSTGDRFKATRFGKGFVVKHYAGSVEYDVDGWLEKNKDPINENLAALLSRSKIPAVATLFEDYAEAATAPANANVKRAGAGRGVKRGAFRTVSQRHRQQLNSLVTQLQSTQPHFVRCIVPNNQKRPGKVEVPLVLEQLRCNGVLEGIRIARLGYPNRLLFAEFRQRYEVMLKGPSPKGFVDSRKASIRIVESLELQPDVYKIGLTKIFFKAGALAEMEEKRDSHLYELFARFQSLSRRYMARRKLNKLLNRASAIRTIQQNAQAYNDLRAWPWWQLYVQIRPLLKATKDQEDAKRRTAELLLAQERAKAEAIEREKTAQAQASLEADRLKLETELAAEKTMAQERDRLLEKANLNEASTREQLEILQKELLALRTEKEELQTRLSTAEELATDANAALEAEREESKRRLQDQELPWQRKAADWSEKLIAAKQGLSAMETVKVKAENDAQDLKEEVARMAQDMDRRRHRSEKQLAEALSQLETEKRRALKLSAEANHAQEDALSKAKQIQQLVSATDDFDGQLKKIRSQAVTVQSKYDALLQEQADIKRTQDESVREKTDLKRRLEQAEAEKKRSDTRLTNTEKELDGLRILMTAKKTAETQDAESRKSMEKEVATLREQTFQVAKRYEEEKRTLQADRDALKMDLDRLRTQELSWKRDKAELTRQYNEFKEKHDAATSTAVASSKALQNLQSDLADVRTQLLHAEEQGEKHRDMAEKASRELSGHRKKLDDQETAITELATKLQTKEKEATMVSREKDQLARDFVAFKEQVVVALTEHSNLQRQLAEAESELETLREAHKKNIVEHKHYHVMEEAKKVTDRQLADAQVKVANLKVELQTFRQLKARMQQDNEDLNRQLTLLKRDFNNAGSVASAPLRKQLEAERQAREAAESKSHGLERLVTTNERKLLEVEKQLKEVRKTATSNDSPKRNSRLLQEMHLNNTELEREMTQRLNDESTKPSGKQSARPEEVALTAEVADLRHQFKEMSKRSDEKLANSQRQIQQMTAKYTDAVRQTEALTEKLEKAVLRLKDVGQLGAMVDSLRAESESAKKDRGALENRFEAEAHKERLGYETAIRDLENKIGDMRDKYQEHLHSLSEDLARQRKDALDYKQANKALKKTEEELRQLLDTELHSSGGWRTMKERLESRVSQATKALQQEKVARQAEEDRHASHISQIQDLNSRVIDLEAEVSALREARRRLQDHLNSLPIDPKSGEFDPSRLTQDRLVSSLTTEKDSLTAALRDAEDAQRRAEERVARLEAWSSEGKAELGRVRVLNAELERKNSELENQSKALQVKLIDLETQGYTNSPRSMVSGARRRPA